jgi:hypothetical protein
MSRHIRKLTMTFLALAALAFGGATLANAAGSHHSKAKAGKSAKHRSHAKSRTTRAAASTPSDGDNVQDPNGADPPGQGEEQGSEVPGNDGPGGHADEPGNPNADHQFQGEE